jgi:hypothetical protein
LAVVCARSLVQLADATEAAGPVLHFNSLRALPRFGMSWVSVPGYAGCSVASLPWGSPPYRGNFTTQTGC